MELDAIVGGLESTQLFAHLTFARLQSARPFQVPAVKGPGCPRQDVRVGADGRCHASRSSCLRLGSGAEFRSDPTVEGNIDNVVVLAGPITPAPASSPTA